MEGYKFLKEQKKDVRGFMFWDISDEGKIPQSNLTNDKNPFYMAKIINSLF